MRKWVGKFASCNQYFDQCKYHAESLQWDCGSLQTQMCVF